MYILETNKTLLDYILVKEIVAPICIIFFSIAFYMIISKIIKGTIRKSARNYDKRKHETIISIANNILKYAIFAIDILMILNIFGINTSAILASLGVIGIVIGLALQDTLKDILAGVSILFENQYAIGDTITVGTFKGEVIGMGLKTTRIRAYTGEIKIIANRTIIEVVNHSLETSLAIVNIGVPYEQDPTKIEKVLNELCIQLTATLENIKGEVTLLGISSFNDSSIEYRLTVETDPMMHYSVERAIRKEIVVAFAKNKITIPYQQMVIHNG